MVIKQNETVIFDSVKTGEVFSVLIGVENVICMKIRAVQVITNRYAECYEAINLANGNVVYCEKDTMVRKIECELIVK